MNRVVPGNPSIKYLLYSLLSIRYFLISNKCYDLRDMTEKVGIVGPRHRLSSDILSYLL